MVVAMLTGTNFKDGTTKVNFSGTGIVVNSVKCVSETQVQVNLTVSSVAMMGYRDIILTTPAGRVTRRDGFEIVHPAPTLSSLSPTTVVLGQDVKVSLAGMGMMGSATAVSFGDGIDVTDVRGSSTALTVSIQISSTARVGTRPVTVTNPAPGGGESSLSELFSVEYPAPLITSVSPSTGTRGRSAGITVTGTGFYPGSTSIDFGTGIVLDSVTVVSSTEIRARATVSFSAAAGAGNVSVTNTGPGGGTATLSSGFAVNNPIPGITAVTPAIGPRGKAVTVQMTGTDFISGATTVDAGEGTTVSALTVTSSTQMAVTLEISAGAAIGNRNVIVTNSPPAGGTATLTNGFLVGNPLPTFVAASPTSGSRGQTLTVNLTGSGFLVGTTSLDFGPNIDVAAVNVISPTRLSATIKINTAAVTGARNIQVTNATPGGGTAALTNGFSVTNPAPTIASVEPANLLRGGSATLVVTGTQFIGGVTSLSFGDGVSVSRLVIRSLTEIELTATVAANAMAGMRDVTVTNAAPGGGSASLSGAFTVRNPDPTLSTLTPASAGRGTFINVLVTGTQLISGVTTVSFGPDITVTSTNVKSPTEMLVSISISPTAATGSRAVSVTNPSPGGGTATLPTGFNVTTSPATAIEGSLGLVPDEYVLHEAYPNPFNPSTRIRYGIPEDSRIELVVHNMLGNIVSVLIVGERSKGLYELQWHAENLPSGVYLVRLHAQSVESTKRFLASRKVVLVK